MRALRACSLLLMFALVPGIRTATASEADVATATQSWVDAFNSREPARVLALYAPDAVFWGTVSPTLRDTPDEIRDYFKGMPDQPHSRVSIGEHRIRVYGDIAINTGSYTFTNLRPDGTTTSQASRFSFTYHHRDGTWWIVDHHSSRKPVPAS